MKKKNGRRVKRLRWNRTFVVLASVLVLAIGLVGTTLAWLFATTDPITNTFSAPKVDVPLIEEFDGEVKEHVKLENRGDIDAFVRAMVVVTWQDEAGNVYAQAPVAGTDYTITWGTEGWTKVGDYYYYNSSIAPGEFTKELIKECKPVEGKAPEGYYLTVEILSDSIQAEPEDAVKEAWGVTIANGTVTAVGN